MTPQMTPNDPRYIDWLVKLAEENHGKGVIEEPRVFWDVVELRNAQPLITDFTGEVYKNGEQFPIRLTHLIVSPRPDWGADPDTQLETLAQYVAIRLRFFDTFYMNQNVLPAPIWVNKVVAAPISVSLGSAHWTFDRPVILSARDTLKIDVQAEPTFTGPTTSNPYRVSVSMTGVGLLSKRPYFLGSTRLITATSKTTLSPTDFKNDGTEPIAITDMGFSVDGGLDSGSGAGDVRRWRMQVQQIGNGTSRPWFTGPATSAGPLVPVSMLGISAGRAIVHRFPGDGILWEPGEGCTAQAQALSSEMQGQDYLLGLAGYITIK